MRRIGLCADFYLPHTFYDGKVMFSVCSRGGRGRGYSMTSGLRFLNYSLVTGPLWGWGYLSFWSQVLSQGGGTQLLVPGPFHSRGEGSVGGEVREGNGYHSFWSQVLSQVAGVRAAVPSQVLGQGCSLPSPQPRTGQGTPSTSTMKDVQ